MLGWFYAAGYINTLLVVQVDENHASKKTVPIVEFRNNFREDFPLSFKKLKFIKHSECLKIIVYHK